jgi:hypothetical protein
MAASDETGRKRLVPIRRSKAARLAVVQDCSLAKADSKSRLKRPAWSVALLLALAVSVWGLHYKLSLYHPSSLHAHGPAAKLLSQKERPTASAQLEQNRAKRRPAASAHSPGIAHSLAVVILTSPANMLQDGRVVPATHDGSRPQLPLSIRPSAARPPPITV